MTLVQTVIPVMISRLGSEMPPQTPGSLCALQGMSREVPTGMIGALGHPAGRPGALRSQNRSVTQSFSSPEYGGCILLCKKLSPHDLWMLLETLNVFQHHQGNVLKMHIPGVQVLQDSGSFHMGGG